MHEESLGFGCDPACHSGLPDYTLISPTGTWEGAEGVPSPLGRRWSQWALLHSALFMHHILTSAGEEAHHLLGGLQALHSWERWGVGTLPTSPVPPASHIPGCRGICGPHHTGLRPHGIAPQTRHTGQSALGARMVLALRTRKGRQRAHRTWADEAPPSQ